MKLLLLAEPVLNAFQTEALTPVMEAEDIEIVGACLNFRKSVSRLEQVKREWKTGRSGYVAVMALNSIAKGRRETSVDSERFHRRTLRR